MKKKYIILTILGLIFIIVPYFINIFSVLRLISLSMGIILFLLGVIIGKKKKIVRIILYPIATIMSVLAFDFIFASVLRGIPVVAFSHESSQKVNTYNSLFYRVYDCDNVLTFDNNYEKAFLCNPDSIETTPINKFLENPKESYKDNKGKFVHLQGKINTIVGNSSLTLNAYDEKIELNGYVVFDEEKKVIIEGLDINPADYHIYDIIQVVGLVSSYKKTETETTIYLTDAVVIKSDLYNKYELIVNNITSREKTKIDEKFYYLGIQGIFYKYDENNIYEIDYLLLDKRETLENLVGNITPSMIEDVHRLYELENYNIVVCENEDIIFANKDITKLKNVCEEEN
ncbi:MAG: hypothetical protein E7167_00290 [Firmicutes bacterium]|nr:hypothetical protein [Bacillota bacterium]